MENIHTHSDTPLPYQRILGIDPGLLHTGWGVIDIDNTQTLKIIAHGVISPSSRMLMSKRLWEIFHSTKSIIDTHQPTLVAIEDTFVNSNPKMSLRLGQARGAALTAVGSTSVMIKELEPRVVKKNVCGSGSADKDQIERMVRMLLPSLPSALKHDTIDAIAIAIAATQQHYNELKWNRYALSV